MARQANLITQERLKELLVYEADTGLLFWKYREDVGKRKNTRYAGKVAGMHDTKGYVKIMLDGKRYQAAHLAWLYIYGELPQDHIDHIDCNPANNKISNLRAATRSQNQCNRGVPPNNTSGYKGVSYAKHRNKWHAYIAINNKRTNLGLFLTKEDAHLAYCTAAKELHGEFARTA